MRMTNSRRSFLKKGGTGLAAAIVAPAILPSGTLFAATNNQKVKHLVLCIMGGGLRNSETVGKEQGNLMPNVFSTLKQQGTFFKGFTYANGPTGHYNAHTAILTGIYTKEDLNVKKNPDYPTLFEYYKKHSANKQNTWWVSNILGPYPSLAHSSDWTYGKAFASQFHLPQQKFHSYSNDISNVLHACSIIEKYQPELMVVNMQDADIAHSNFTAYCESIKNADLALITLWNKIQNTPGMANNTVLITLPEHGRNEKGNGIVDANGFEGLDHTGDAASRELFCLMLGPDNVIQQNHTVENQSGESVDILPTIASLLGFYENIPSVYRKKMGKILDSAFV